MPNEANPEAARNRLAERKGLQRLEFGRAPERNTRLTKRSQWGAPGKQNFLQPYFI
jgi:hypothetical protein